MPQPIPQPRTGPGVQPSEAAAADPDVRLMLRVKAGDQQAFKELFAKHQRKIVNFSRRYLGSVARAEDAAQETFLRLYRARADYQPQTKLSTYLYRIATNTCLNHLRKRDWLVREDAEADGESATERVPDTSAQGPEENLSGRELQARIIAALQSLPESQRAALILLRFDDLSYEEIAEVMQSTVPAVKSLLNRAKEQLLKKLAPDLSDFSVPYQKGKDDGL